MLDLSINKDVFLLILNEVIVRLIEVELNWNRNWNFHTKLEFFDNEKEIP